ELRKRCHFPLDIVLLGDEPFDPYDRIKLSQLLAGNINYSDIFSRLHSESEEETRETLVRLHYETRRVHTIEPERKWVLDGQGNATAYDHLVIATGSRPHVPQVEGADLAGVYTFRNLRDAEQLCTRINR